ncbi:MAG TPA: TonB-dependent receptor, partial [Puia sp.]|nr:TonB-dependent receptor [Puia sp.]
SSDLQGLLTYQINNKNSLELMGTISQTKFSLIPEFSQLSSSVFSPYFTANLALDVFFTGQEQDRYQTNMLGLSWNQQINPHLKFKWMVSHFQDNEKETYDITGDYLFGERNFDKGSPDFGSITNPLGAGTYQNFARDQLSINVWNFSHKGFLELGKNYLQWGISAENQTVSDKLHEWQRQDSAGYTLPHIPDSLEMFTYLHSNADLNINRFTGFIQDNLAFTKSGDFTLQGGLRYNYNKLNKEFLLSPRIGFSWKPRGSKKDIIYRGAIGIYDQPPFYRELRRMDGTVNTDLKAQKSWQVTAGFDYNFHVGDRPFRFTTEAYYKGMWDVVPYDVDNVRIRYYGENSAKAYAVGMEMRLFGELVKDAESWISLGIMKTKEKIQGAYYYDYTLDSLNKPVDSVRVEQGWVRRPTDRLLTLGMFIQDYLSTNKNFKLYMNVLYGSNLPFNIPGSVKYRNALIIDPYIRVDLGFSALLLD